MKPDRLSDTFVELADTLVDDFDVAEFLDLLADRCVELLGVDLASPQLADARGRLRAVTDPNGRPPVEGLLRVQAVEGPAVDAFATGTAVAEPALASADADRWPAFTEAAVTAGFAAVDAVPMRLRTEVVGALSLYRSAPGPLDPTALRTATALVEVATIGLLQQRAIHHHQVVAEQLQAALTSRVTIEQAKGLVAERLGIDVDGAFGVLRGFARASNLKLAEVALAVVEGRIGNEQLVGAGTRRKPPRSP